MRALPDWPPSTTRTATNRGRKLRPVKSGGCSRDERHHRFKNVTAAVWLMKPVRAGLDVRGLWSCGEVRRAVRPALPSCGTYSHERKFWPRPSEILGKPAVAAAARMAIRERCGWHRQVRVDGWQADRARLSLSPPRYARISNCPSWPGPAGSDARHGRRRRRYRYRCPASVGCSQSSTVPPVPQPRCESSWIARSLEYSSISRGRQCLAP